MNHNDDRVTIYNALDKAALENGSLNVNGLQVKRLQMQEIARRAGGNMRPARVGELMSKSGQKSPSLLESARLAEALHLSLEELPDRSALLFPSQRHGVVWRLSGVPCGTRPRACRNALGRLLEGQSQEEIREAIEVVYAAHEQRPLHLDESAVRDMIQGGLSMGLARFEPEPNGALEERDLASELASSLEHDPHALPRGGLKQRPVVRVVKNLAHPSFALDPVAPHLVARVAHDIVAEHLRVHRTVYSIGLAGGIHCSTFVNIAGAESSPFPDDSGDKQINFVPLTLEPFSSQRLPIANSVVGKMVERAGSLLGSRRVDGLSLQSFGYAVEDSVSQLDDQLIKHVQQRYRELDVAIFGCGDLESDGWLERAMRGAKTEGGVQPATDVCLNLLAEDGSSIPLQDGRQFVGIGLADIRRLVQRDDRLALLLTSGRAKGRPIVVASRAGCVDTIVCDRAAAEAALEVLARGW